MKKLCKLENKFLLTLVFLVFSQISFAETDFSKEEFKVLTLTPSMYMLEGAGGNITASIGTDGVLLVDDDFAEMGEKLLAKLKELKGGSPKYIVNTHFHYDHSGGNKFFGKSATVIAATEVRNRLETTQKLWGEDHGAYSSEHLPSLTFNKSLTLHFNQDEVRVLHLPHGHTDGDSVVFFRKEKVVSMGDLYFSGMYPIFHSEHNGSLNGFIKNIKSVLDQTPMDAQIVPGHGPLSSRAELEKYYRMILASKKVVQAGISRHLTLFEIQKKGLPIEWESFSHGYLTTDKWIALVYKNLN